MEARYLILARYAEFTGDGLVNIIGGDNDKLAAEEYPYIHPLLLAAARVVLDRTDSEREHDITTVIVDADTEEVIAQGCRQSSLRWPYLTRRSLWALV